ncbi:MAG: DUF559 domain-containing protein [Mesorhizobium sp.]|nr:endonuclease domain-containing protein [Mesorhizobium sp.]MBL8579176.1 DUF559 domain-containing protein [Mesorhizobium sp.]
MPRTLVTAEMRIKAKGQRRFATRGETLVWYELRDLKAEGLKFRRQSPIGPYVADFVCFDPKVVVEIDGDQHETESGKRHDSNRDEYMRASGFMVLRYDAGDALTHAWHIARDVRDKAGALPRLPHPSRYASHPPREGEGEVGV